MAARKTGDAALATQEKAAALKQKKADEDARMRIKCLEIASTVQTLRTNALSIIHSAETIFAYAKTGKLPD